MHNWPGLPVGEFAVVRGPAMASAEAFNITVEGTGGHAAMPHTVRDPIVAASAIVAAAQTIVSRVVDPLDNAVVSITAIHGGEAFNVIPDRVEMKGTIRTFSEAVSKSIEAELARICEKTAEAFGTKARLHRPPKLPYPATVNHPAETELALGAMRAVAGPDRVRDDMRPVMGSEDFAFILRKVPGAYIFVGNGDTAGLHNPKVRLQRRGDSLRRRLLDRARAARPAGLNGQSIERASARRPWIAAGQRLLHHVHERRAGVFARTSAVNSNKEAPTSAMPKKNRGSAAKCRSAIHHDKTSDTSAVARRDSTTFVTQPLLPP